MPAWVCRRLACGAALLALAGAAPARAAADEDNPSARRLPAALRALVPEGQEVLAWRRADLNLDGLPDDLTGAGLVYVVFGGKHLTGTISLGQIGTDNLPGVIFVGRKAGDALGGGLTQGGLLSQGLSPAGDVDGDGRADIMLSSVLADPEGKTNAGEVYLIYGFRP